MSNLLAIPFKKTYAINLKEATRSYLLEHGGTHPDAVKTDISQWEQLRQRGVGGDKHADRVNDILRYHAQLTSILAKLPADIRLDIAYAPVFSPSALPITLRNLVFERASIVFNLAALYSQLAAAEDRSHGDGIKRAGGLYQNASGSLQYLRTEVLPKLIFSPEDEERPLDLSIPFVHALEWLMLAQAQECYWQKARLDNYKNALISKLAASASKLYQNAMTAVREASPPVKHLFPNDWLAHIQAKQHHFEAVALYRKSRDELESSRYGYELAYLTQVLSRAKKAYDVARKGKVSPAVLHDVQAFLEAVQKDVTRAERDNDLIYHQDVPTSSALPQIAHATVAQITVPKELVNPNEILANENMLFSELLGWGAREAINIYNDRRKNLIQDELVQSSREARDQADQTLRELNLPASLEALERPIGLPPSLLKKAEEVRLENGPVKIEAAIKDLRRLARQNNKILDEAMDILDHEASEDENTRATISLDRPPSHEANVHLIEKEKRYRRILEQARESDETIRTKWDQWEQNITELTWEEADLEASIPSTTISADGSLASDNTGKRVRILRVLLEQLDSLHSEREDIVRRAQKLAEVDDIQPRIAKAAAGFARLAEVQPTMFEDISDEGLSKYDKFMKWIKELQPRQEELLDAIRAENESFLQSRKDDANVKDRERALQSLDISYHKYQEIIRNLEEGIKFYNDLIAILMQFRKSCKQWSNERSREVHTLSRAMQSLDIGSTATSEVAEEEDMPNTPSAPQNPAVESASSFRGLPPLNSSDWGFEAVSLPPGPKKFAKQR
ncbi:ph-response regulator protein pala rim20 [Moniliophthora roreri MCA 2997]|uniref:Ph-response regulator protein pala rim20 n=1 Tax=Moniliophthora roreri (strain MCA 2997) TaxID=1381753 RepID=V2X7L9_MONRO|nr:ph-response regulator protein pala rim20 [Moniliophthora roreri MCA 2997]